MYNVLSLTLLASLARLVFGLVFNKVVAATLGPSGLILLSNFQNILQISSRISNFGVETGIASGISNKSLSTDSIVSNSYFILLVFSLINLVMVYILSDQIVTRIFDGIEGVSDVDKNNVLIIIGLFGPLVGFSANLISMANGLNKADLYSKCTILAAFFSLSLLCSFYFYVGYSFIVLMWAISQSIFVVFFIMLIGYSRNVTFKIHWHLVNFRELQVLLTYSRMTVISIVTSALAAMIFRFYVLDNLNIGEAGSWQAIVKLTETINGVLFVWVTFYLIPKYSNVTNWKEFIGVTKNIFLVLSLCYMSGILVLYFFSDLIITLLFSKNFILPFKYIFIQFIGGYFQILAWLFGLVLVVKKMVLYHTLSQVTSVILVILVGYIMINNFMLSGAVFSFAITSLILLFFNIMYIRRWFKDEICE
ncbi:MAG: hypothetical protein ACSHW0_14200 [Thalassotalea sp.]